MLFGLEKLNSSKLPFGKGKFWVQLLKVFKVSFIIFKKKKLQNGLGDFWCLISIWKAC